MSFLRLYLLAGMVLHKAVWEVLKRRQRHSGKRRPRAQGAMQALIKTAKIGVLAGVLAQTVLPEVLPIMTEPLVLRLVGIPLYTFGLLLALAGRVRLGENWADIEAADVSRTQTIVSTGPYRYIRHPIYAGDLLLLCGLELSLNSWFVLGVLLIAPFAVRQAVREERMLAGALPGYDRYCASTKRFVPFVI